MNKKYNIMKNITLFSRQVLILGICIAFISCSSTNKNQFPNPEIMVGTTKIAGKIEGYNSKEDTEKPILKLYVPSPITSETSIFETDLNEDGTFNFEVTIECNPTIATLASPIFDKILITPLVSNKETKLIITKNEENITKVNVTSDIELTSNDILNLGDVINKMLESMRSSNSSPYKMTPQDFTSAVIKDMEEALNKATKDSTLSKRTMNFISNEFKLINLRGYLLDYEGYMVQNYQNYKTEEDPEEFTPQKIDKSYYRFLKYFNLNDPQYLYSATYFSVLKSMLFNETLNIPLINDTPIDQWLKGVKTTMADLIGADNGLFYDMLVINAYTSQFENSLTPLSEIQTENIKKYFKNKDITNILLKKNEDILKLANQKSNPIIRETPTVSHEELMSTIISKYKGKVVMVDFWATWCGPCIAAMKEFRETKNSYENKNIVFVYITNTSSPLNLWNEKIKGIGGEHYYLTKNEWEYLLDSFDFQGIPAYQLYDADGVLKNQQIGYPGTIEMQTLINELLP